MSDQLRVIHAIEENLRSCILGKEEEIRLLLTAMLAEGHVLLKDVPGTGKTVLIKALAKSVQAQFRRIQCNPDLLPTDITGVSIYHPKTETFLYRPGPVMTHILLVDEINRATTKTQSALLEAMEEKQVTVDGGSYPLPTPFLLMATQNPVDFEGTYVLPEAQLDRFMLCISLGYPDEAAEKQMLSSHSKIHPLEPLRPVADREAVLALQQQVKNVHVDVSVIDYLTSICRKTREHPSVLLGASPRAALALLQAAKAFALIHSRDYVLPDDVKYLAPHVLGHRLLLQAQARLEGTTSLAVLQSIYQQLKVPL